MYRWGFFFLWGCVFLHPVNTSSMRFYICKYAPFPGLPSGRPGCVVFARSGAVYGVLPVLPGVSSVAVLCGCPGGVSGRFRRGAASVPGCVPGCVVGAGCVVILCTLCTRAGLHTWQVQVLTSRLNWSNDLNELNGSSRPNGSNDLNDSLFKYFRYERTNF